MMTSVRPIPRRLQRRRRWPTSASSPPRQEILPPPRAPPSWPGWAARRPRRRAPPRPCASSDTSPSELRSPKLWFRPKKRGRARLFYKKTDRIGRSFLDGSRMSILNCWWERWGNRVQWVGGWWETGIGRWRVAVMSGGWLAVWDWRVCREAESVLVSGSVRVIFLVELTLCFSGNYEGAIGKNQFTYDFEKWLQLPRYGHAASPTCFPPHEMMAEATIPAVDFIL